MKKLLFTSLIAIAVLAILTGCSSTNEKADSEKTESQSSDQRQGFREFPIGDEVEAEGMNIAAVYFQPVVMEPKENAGFGPDEADIHLEADIHALKDNPNGLGFGEWVPYMTVEYKLENLGNGKVIEGSFMPMNAADGPHYGANVKMAGTGEYKLTFNIYTPQLQGMVLHTDPETGVEGRFWDAPITVEWEFPYLGRQW